MAWLSALNSVTLDKTCHPFFIFCLAPEKKLICKIFKNLFYLQPVFSLLCVWFFSLPTFPHSTTFSFFSILPCLIFLLCSSFLFLLILFFYIFLCFPHHFHLFDSLYTSFFFSLFLPFISPMSPIPPCSYNLYYTQGFNDPPNAVAIISSEGEKRGN